MTARGPGRPFPRSPGRMILRPGFGPGRPSRKKSALCWAFWSLTKASVDLRNKGDSLGFVCRTCRPARRTWLRGGKGRRGHRGEFEGLLKDRDRAGKVLLGGFEGLLHPAATFPTTSSQRPDDRRPGQGRPGMLASPRDKRSAGTSLISLRNLKAASRPGHSGR